MKIVSAAEMRDLDRRTVEEYGLSGTQLMENAGIGLAVYLQELIRDYEIGSGRILFVAGRGNNGGDAFVAAAVLTQLQYNVELWLACSLSDLKGDALIEYQKMSKLGVYVEELSEIEDWENMDLPSESFEIIVDGLLGTGSNGPARGVIARAIDFINERIDDSIIVSIDIPSGLDSDSGESNDCAVFADYTLSIAQPKQGLLKSCAADYVGRVDILDIGIPDEFIDKVRGELGIEFISKSDAREMMPPHRKRNSHKGCYGHVLLIGGSVGFSGAIIMSAKAALKSGVGLVSVYVPEKIWQIVATAVPEAMVFPIPEITENFEESWKLKNFDSILIGPGIGRSDETIQLVKKLLEKSTVPVVLDADAITSMQGQLEILTAANCPLILTPHPGECATLLGLSVAEVQEDRRNIALEAACRTNSVTILKGAGTIVAVPEGALAISMSGNPGMSKGGAGDVLAGVLTGLIPQIPDVYVATCLAVYVHGTAGDYAAIDQTQMGMTAMDIIDQIPNVFHSLTVR